MDIYGEKTANDNTSLVIYEDNNEADQDLRGDEEIDDFPWLSLLKTWNNSTIDLHFVHCLCLILSLHNFI